MNVLIAGKNEINEALQRELVNRDFGVHVISNIESLTQLKGHPGHFEAATSSGKIPAAGVIITEPPAYEDVVIGDGKAINLTYPDLLGVLNNATDSKIIFLLDYLSETPEHLTAKALENALYLTQQNRQVVFLSRFVKTSSNGMEQVYREARQEGVTFIKYERINCAFQDGIFNIQVFDGTFTSDFSTSSLISIGNEAGSKQIIKKFRLASTNSGYINGNKFFLDPILTSRKGVFYFNPNLNERSSHEGVQKIISNIVTELHSLADDPISYGEIDAKKCAFCYSCYRACPHAALEPDIENDAMKCVVPSCFACGACAAICPGQAITIKNADTPVLVSDAAKDKCKVFCCENAAYLALSSIDEDAGKFDIEKIPCGGRIGQDWIA
ncbi:MAG: 4Fe-4S binding protein, partial [Defluviitaleaceae bacterium]|nr:4Fe-4S binding protein [Defluviitaleaceae bacterium]